MVKGVYTMWSPTLDTFDPAKAAWINALKEAGLDPDTPMPINEDN